MHKRRAVCLLPMAGDHSVEDWLNGQIVLPWSLASKVLLLGIGQRGHCWSEAELQKARRKKRFQSVTLGSVSLQDLSLRVPAAGSEWNSFLDQARRILAGLNESPVAKEPAAYRQAREEEMQRQRDYGSILSGRSWVTPGWMACGLLSYLCSIAVPGSLAWKMARLGAILPGLSLGQQSWRLATAPWISQDFWLLAILLLYFWDLGLFLERMVGSAAMLALLVASACAGGLAGWIWCPWVALGSGYALIAGLCSASLSLSWLWRKRLPRTLRHRLRSGNHHGLAFVVLTFCLQNQEIPLFAAGFSAGLLVALAIWMFPRWLRLAWVCLAFPIWGLLGLGLRWNVDVSPFSFPRKAFDLAGGTRVLLPGPFRADSNGISFNGPGGFVDFYGLEKPEGDVVAALEHRSKVFGQPLKHLPGGVWTYVSIPPDSGFTQVGVCGYSQGKLVMIRAGCTVGNESVMRAYLEEILDDTQGRIQLPPEVRQELPAIYDL